MNIIGCMRYYYEKAPTNSINFINMIMARFYAVCILSLIFSLKNVFSKPNIHPNMYGWKWKLLFTVNSVCVVMVEVAMCIQILNQDQDSWYPSNNNNTGHRSELQYNKNDEWE